jgi:hypothetical protein
MKKKTEKNTIKKVLIKLDTKEICNFSNNVFCFLVRVVYKKIIVHLCQKVPFVLASTKKPRFRRKNALFSLDTQITIHIFQILFTKSIFLGL